MKWDRTNMIGAMALTLLELETDENDADLIILHMLRIRKRYTDAQIEYAGLSWIARMLPDDLFLPPDLFPNGTAEE